MKLKSAVSAFLNMIFPPRCVLCGEIVSLSDGICPNCARKIPHIHIKKRISVPKAGHTILCTVPYAYDGKIRESIIRFKFYGQTRSAEFFGTNIAGELLEHAAEFDFVSAVPVSASRRRQRGYNQSELVARVAAQKLGLPYRECLVKTADNKEQHKLNVKERQQNVQGVYELSQNEEISGKRVLLVDDIVTTGATLCECAEVLFAGRAKEVSCAAIAAVEL